MLESHLDIRVEWGHCDPARIVVYNPNFYDWMEHGLLAFSTPRASISRRASPPTRSFVERRWCAQRRCSAPPRGSATCWS